MNILNHYNVTFLCSFVISYSLTYTKNLYLKTIWLVFVVILTYFDFFAIQLKKSLSLETALFLFNETPEEYLVTFQIIFKSFVIKPFFYDQLFSFLWIGKVHGEQTNSIVKTTLLLKPWSIQLLKYWKKLKCKPYSIRSFKSQMFFIK